MSGRTKRAAVVFLCGMDGWVVVFLCGIMGGEQR